MSVTGSGDGVSRNVLIGDRAWSAPVADRPVRATVAVPGSKSLTNRALVLAAQATSDSAVIAPLRSRDTDLMADGLRAMGTRITDDGAGNLDWRVHPQRLAGPATVDCGLAGTVMRFLPALAAIASGPVTFDGDPAARRRPMATVLDALRSLGADIDGDRLPFVVHGTGALAGGTVHIDASASSQFVSGLLLSGASFADGVRVVHRGGPLPSMPHISMTVANLRSVGVSVDDSQTDEWTVRPGPVAPWTAVIEPDLSNATPFLAAAAITAGTVTIPHWPPATDQAGDAIRGILAAMGAGVALADGGVTVEGPQTLQGVDLDLHDVGELTPTIAAVALFADGPSVLRGIGHLRGHETDRLAAIAGNIAALGGDVREDSDALTIRPAPVARRGLALARRPPDGDGGRDHRAAGARRRVDDIATTAKTLPGFDRMWACMLTGPAAPSPGVAS